MFGDPAEFSECMAQDVHEWLGCRMQETCEVTCHPAVTDTCAAHHSLVRGQLIRLQVQLALVDT
jgi:hypothetical protein